MVSESSTYVVIGAGLAGAATAWRLAAAGHEVTVLERSHPANADGSSHGSARIFRYAYPDRLYTDLVIEARHLWDQLEQDAAETLITPTGALDSGQIRRPRLLASVLEDAGIAHELLAAEEAATRFPMLRVETEVLWHPGAGVIDSERSVAAMLRLAERDGARVGTEWDVTDVERTGTGFRLTASTGEVLEAGQLLVCAGGWLPQLLDRLPLPDRVRAAMPTFTVRQEQAHHFPYREDIAAPRSWPTFIHKSPTIETYGLPGGRDADFGGQKICEFRGGKPIPSAVAHDHRIDPLGRERVVDFARRHLPGVRPESYAESTCLFTSTPSEDFLLDTHEGITVVSPCSGHGGKFAPLIGELAAGLATEAGTVPEIFRATTPSTLHRTP